MNKKNINKTNETITRNSRKNIRNKSIDEFIYMGEIMNGEKIISAKEKIAKKEEKLEVQHEITNIEPKVKKTKSIKLKTNKVISSKKEKSDLEK
jgi:hypothetical protein